MSDERDISFWEYYASSSSGEDPINPLPTGADKYFAFSQAMPAATWTVTHNLEKYPSVTVVNSTGEVVFGAVKYTSLNSRHYNFYNPFLDGLLKLNLWR
jgi:hypothetical protein